MRNISHSRPENGESVIQLLRGMAKERKGFC